MVVLGAEVKGFCASDGDGFGCRVRAVGVMLDCNKEFGGIALVVQTHLVCCTNFQTSRGCRASHDQRRSP